MTTKKLGIIGFWIAVGTVLIALMCPVEWFNQWVFLIPGAVAAGCLFADMWRNL